MAMLLASIPVQAIASFFIVFLLFPGWLALMMRRWLAPQTA